MTKFEGILPALVTPLNEDETVNTAVLSDLIEYLIGKGADGFYVGGATGEGIALSAKESIILAEGSIDAIKGRKPCIIHIASVNFNEAIELAKHAERVGADGISAIPPLFFSYSEDDVYNYYKRLAESVNIPLMIYFNPAAGFNINAKFAARAFEVDNITAIKWTSSNYYEMMKLKDLTNGEMNIINGPDEMLLMGLSAGADAGIGTTYNFMLPLYRGVYDNFRAGNIEKAHEYQCKIAHIISAMRAYPTIPVTKALVEAMGYEVGNATFPMKVMTKEKKAEAVKALESAGWECIRK
jgi:N-acetylneuraminate lyase